MMKRKHTISESEIKAELAAMREVVAAPRDFRSKILNRLAVETGQAAPAPKASLWQSLRDFAARPLLAPALTASLLLGFGLWLALRPAPQAQVPGGMPVVSGKQPVRPQLAKIHRVKPAQKVEVAKITVAPEPETVTEVQGSVTTQNSALGGVGVMGNPTAVVQSTPTALPSPLSEHSQVRRNRFLASRGEYAAILFNMSVPGNARIEAYDRSGHRVALIHEGQHGAGVFEIRWYGHDDSGQIGATGIYLIRVKTDDYDERHKVVLVK